MCTLVLNKAFSIKYIALASDPFLGPCCLSLLCVVCIVISDAAAEKEGATGWIFPSSGGERAKSIAASPSPSASPLPSPTCVRRI